MSESDDQERPLGHSIPRNRYELVGIPAEDVSTSHVRVDSSRFCLYVLSVISIALAIDVLFCMLYIYNKPPMRRNNSKIASNSVVQWKELPSTESVLTKVAFGSCASQHMPQPYWDTLLEYGPDIVLLTGDNVYGDCTEPQCEVLRDAYVQFAQLASVQGAAPHLSVFPTLDDHDYGMNDCHASNPYKDIAKSMFVDFFGIEHLPTDGVYRAQTWGPTGQRLQVILLDTRYNRSPFNTKDGSDFDYIPMNDSTPQHMLGESQWKWLQERLQESADLRLLVSSIQVLNDVTHNECWRHLPKERNRLYNLLLEESSTIILSGDRHVGGFYQLEGSNIREVTASSWTHSVPLAAEHNCTTAEECDEKDPTRLGSLIRDNNWGSVEIDWTKRQCTVALRRADSSYGVAYLEADHHNKTSDAGEILEYRIYTF